MWIENKEGHSAIIEQGRVIGSGETRSADQYRIVLRDHEHFVIIDFESKEEAKAAYQKAQREDAELLLRLTEERAELLAEVAETAANAAREVVATVPKLIFDTLQAETKEENNSK